MDDNHAKFLQQHQGKHPIIHFNMADISGSFFGPNAIKNDISFKIRKLFQENVFLINAMDKAIITGKLEKITGTEWKREFLFYHSTMQIQMDQWKNGMLFGKHLLGKSFFSISIGCSD